MNFNRLRSGTQRQNSTGDISKIKIDIQDQGCNSESKIFKSATFEKPMNALILTTPDDHNDRNDWIVFINRKVL